MKDYKILLILVSCMFSMIGCSAKASKTNALLPGVAVSSSQVDSAEPAISAAPDGGVYVSWVEHNETDKIGNILVQKFDTEGKPSGKRSQVNPIAEQAKSWRGDPPSLFVGNDGAIYVTWTAKNEASSHASDLVLSVSRDGGKTFGSPTKVNDDTLPAVHGMHSLTADKDGRIYVAWLDERYLAKAAPKEVAPKPDEPAKPHKHVEANRDVYFAVSSDGGKTFSANKKLASDACPCCKTSLVASPAGEVYVAWRQVLPGDFRHMAVASLTDGGNKFSTPVIVSDDRWQISACPVSGATLNITAGNKLKVAWFTAGAAGASGIYETESADGGKTFAPRRLVSERMAFGTPTIVANSAGGFKIVWSDEEKLILADVTNTQAAREFGMGDTPIAAVAGKKLFVASTKQANRQRSVKLTVVNE